MLGLINVLKPTGLTSSDVVVRVRSRVRQLTGDKTIKVGHLGTLDPNASGVLPIVIGKATRLFDYCINDHKLYRACFRFGKTTDTLDSDGKVTATTEVIPTLLDIKRVLSKFVGIIEQIPPLYSSISVGGVKGYVAGRQNLDIDLPKRTVKVFDIQLIRYNQSEGELWLDIACSGGTYIRSICRDLAFEVGTLGYMPALVRLENKGLKIEDSVPLDDITSENIVQYILDVDCLIGELERVDLGLDEGRYLLNGISVKGRNILGNYLVYIDGKLLGICRDKENIIEVYIRLWE